MRTMRRFLGIGLCLCLVSTTIHAKETAVRRNAIKTTFLSWISGSCKISYERAVWENQTMEMTVGYIGFGWDKYDNNPEGYTVRYAHKFMLLGNDRQPLNGFYLRPELIYSRYYYDTEEFRQRELSRMGSAVFTVGYQYVIRRLVVDAYFGGGYAWGKEADTHYQHGFSLWDYFGSYNKNISMTFGVKLGVCF